MGLGKGTDQMPVQWASSAIFAVANTQRRAMARNHATEYLARERALATPEVQNDEELKAAGAKDFAGAKQQLERTVRRAYQHLCYLAQPDANRERYLDQISFDDENSSAINGTIAWKALVEREKVFDAGQFDTNALVHNLRDTDYGRTLSEIRSAFYRAPRLPLLYAGDTDLRQAIHDAAVSGLLDIADGAGVPVVVTAPGEVNLTSAGLRLAKPKSEPSEEEGPAQGGGEATGGSPTEIKGGEPIGGVPEPSERQLKFTVIQNLLGNPDGANHLAEVFRVLYQALDESKVSYLQGTVSVMLDAATAEELREKLAELGVEATIKDM
jgi:hypothetical protein